MKKNKMMRVASFLLVAVLLSTSVISGTFAKYVTEDSAQDVARVAKFGVTVTASGELFGVNYLAKTDDTPTSATAGITVKSSDATKLVAPGTKSSDDGVQFAVAGTPEVNVKVEVDVTDGYKEVFLKTKTGLPDMTTGDETDTFDNASDYYPVKFTLTKNGTALVTDGKLSDVETALEALSADNIAAGTDLATQIGTLKLTWKWDFDDNGNGTYDKQDTLLGDLIAGTTLAPATTLAADTDYSVNTNFEITVSVTQVD